eukprot:TRINITY_DN2375_c0_g2_i5.p1 TRINITY_DN2375_c0_g2~~TRINITY_DN2375_c0_g2_i5.p1  ORF type:complete len:135 (-),score=35.62 TRINITY_DN2375_c0_g2_i5:573-977(-)
MALNISLPQFCILDWMLERSLLKSLSKVLQGVVQSVLGFNSGKYDMTFVVQHMINPIIPIEDIITKANSYMKLGYGDYHFMDARNYVPPNINLDRFGKMWGVEDIEKGIFPYEWLNSIEKLGYTELPPIETKKQ